VASGKVSVEVAVDASVLAVQALTVFVLSVFVASVNGWKDCCFDEAFSSDDC
jgi:hypothetical protein